MIDDIIQEVNRLIADHDWKSLNERVGGLEVTKMPHTETLAWLRSSYVVRRCLPDYQPTVLRAREFFTTTGDEAKMKGL